MLASCAANAGYFLYLTFWRPEISSNANDTPPYRNAERCSAQDISYIMYPRKYSRDADDRGCNKEPNAPAFIVEKDDSGEREEKSRVPRGERKTRLGNKRPGTMDEKS